MVLTKPSKDIKCYLDGINKARSFLLQMHYNTNEYDNIINELVNLYLYCPQYLVDTIGNLIESLKGRQSKLKGEYKNEN